MKCEHLHRDLSNAYNLEWKYKMCKAEQSVSSLISADTGSQVKLNI